MPDNDLFERGLEKRKQVLGDKYVDTDLAGSDDFMMTFQRAVTELAWGYVWSRPGLDQKTRSILTLGVLAGLGRFQELGIYTNAAIASGVTVDEIKEVRVHITIYCGSLNQQRTRTRKFRSGNPESARAARRASDHRRRTREQEEMLVARTFTVRGLRRAQIKRRARKYGRTCAIDDLVLRVPTHCPLSGIPLDGRDLRHTPSIDRIDNTLGYEPGNVGVVSRWGNHVKRMADLETAKHRLRNRTIL